MAATPDRLPWLIDEPAGSAGTATGNKSAGRMWPWYLLLLLLVAAVGAGAWWLVVSGRDASPPELPAEQSLPIPVTPAAPSEPSPTQTDGEQAAVAPGELPPTAAPRSAPAAPRTASRRPAAPVSALPTPTGEAAVGRSIFPADEPVAAPPPIGPNPVVAVNPRPYGGRVVQLGAFPTRKQAEDVWSRVTRRYPYLKSKAKMVNTVDVRGLGGGRPTRMFRLQLGTSSQAQSVVICQQLERAGHSCVVVY